MMFLIPASAFLVTVVAYAFARVICPRIGLLDFPDRYGLQRKRIPYPVGGIAVAIFLLYFTFLTSETLQVAGLSVGIVLLAVTSFIDDRRPLPSSLRLGIQLLVVFIIFAAGSRIYTITSPLEGFIKLDTFVVSIPIFGSLPILSGIITMSWLLLTINAMNWFDGIPGQVSVISTIGFLMLGLLAHFRNDQPEIALLAYTLCGIAAAGIFVDFPPAKALLGDSGSMFFGLMIGVVGVYQGGKLATAFLVIGIPLIDAAFVIIGRMYRKKSPFSGGRDHLHHTLLALGLSERTIVVLMALLGTVFGVSALFLSTTGKFIALLLVILLLLALQIVIRRLQTSARTPVENSLQ